MATDGWPRGRRIWPAPRRSLELRDGKLRRRVASRRFTAPARHSSSRRRHGARRHQRRTDRGLVGRLHQTLAERHRRAYSRYPGCHTRHRSNPVGASSASLATAPPSTTNTTSSAAPRESAVWSSATTPTPKATARVGGREGSPRQPYLDHLPRWSAGRVHLRPRRSGGKLDSRPQGQEPLRRECGELRSRRASVGSLLRPLACGRRGGRA